MAVYYCLWESTHHCLVLEKNALLEVGLLREEIACPFLQDLRRPPRAKQTSLGEPQENVPHPKGLKDVRIEHDDEAISDLSHPASNSWPSRCRSSNAAARSPSRRRL